MTHLKHFTQSGFQVFPAVIDNAGVDSLIADLPLLDGRPETKQRDGQIYGARNLLRLLPSVQRLATDSPYAELADELLGASGFPVRAIFFDKVPGANWDASWHQDLTIAVKERKGAPGFGKWTIKNGVPHVEPPAEILERMVTLRLQRRPAGHPWITGEWRSLDRRSCRLRRQEHPRHLRSYGGRRSRHATIDAACLALRGIAVAPPGHPRGIRRRGTPPRPGMGGTVNASQDPIRSAVFLLA